MTAPFRDPSEEMKRLLRRLDEIDETQQLQAIHAECLERFEVTERTGPLSDSGDRRSAHLRPDGRQLDPEGSRRFRKRRLAQRSTVAGVLAATVATIVMVKTPAISIALISDGFNNSKSEMLQPGARASHDAAPTVQPPSLVASRAIDSEGASRRHARLIVASGKTSLPSNQVWPIGLGSTPDGEGGTLVIEGLAEGTMLPVGRPLHADSWELNADDLNSAFIIPPNGFVGTMDLTIELRLGGATVDKRNMQVEWLGNTTSTPQQASATEMTNDDMTRLLMRGEALRAGGEIAAARAMFKHLAKGGDPRAALALAETYERATLDRLGARGLVPDRGMAQTWYERAKEMGSIEAQHRLDLLASRSE